MALYELSPISLAWLGERAARRLELERTAAIQRFDWSFGAGDKVMQVENDYD